jgi:hypothetical protein
LWISWLVSGSGGEDDGEVEVKGDVAEDSGEVKEGVECAGVVEEEVAAVVGAVAMYCGSNWSASPISAVWAECWRRCSCECGKCGVTVNCGEKVDRVKGGSKHRVVKEGVECAAVVVVDVVVVVVVVAAVAAAEVVVVAAVVAAEVVVVAEAEMTLPW